jgi:hypothetical protein
MVEFKSNETRRDTGLEHLMIVTTDGASTFQPQGVLGLYETCHELVIYKPSAKVIITDVKKWQPLGSSRFDPSLTKF